jgi:eukaryotic-like serine/threonine-protein kinase
LRPPRRQRDLSVSFNHVGDVQVARGDLTGALTSYRDTLAIRDRLAKSDPGNAGWQRDLSVSYEKVGDVQVAQGDLTGALTSYRDTRAIRDRLAKSDPGNAGWQRWQRDLAISHFKLASVYERQTRIADALAELTKGRDIIVALVAMVPDNAQWKNDLAQCEAQIARLHG